VAPLQLGGLRGKQSTPSVGWEVLVRSRRSARGVAWRAWTSFEAGDQAKVRSLISRVECIRIYELDLHVCWVIWMEEYLTSIGVGSRWIEWFSLFTYSDEILCIYHCCKNFTV
jgi:hypothetical protein